MKAKLEISCSKDKLGEIRNFVEEKLASYALSDLDKNQIILAIDEACANAIIHGNQCDQSKILKLELEIADNILGIKIYDVGSHNLNKEAHQFQLTELIKQKKKGGMGLKLIHSIMDGVHYYSAEDKNICSLTKILK